MITIWHNPHCSKSRQTLALLESKGPVTIRLYLEDTPTAKELHNVLDLLGMSAIEIMRTNEPDFKELGLSGDLDTDRLIAAMLQAPRLIERPIVVANGKAAIGRPPENVLALL